ncbi:MAG: type III pantothenate kinase, partial [Pseudomonadota bacterium]
MLLAIDVGNTNTVFALCQSQGDAEARIVAEWRIVTDGRRTADQYFVWLSQLMRHHWIDADDVSAILIASVAPETLFNLHTLAERYFNTRAMVIGDPGLDLGIAVKTDRPAEVGADRVVNALAAHQSYGPDLIVLDFGTATTFDIVDETGAYAGGVIAP